MSLEEKSIWQVTSDPIASFPMLEGEHEAEVLVIGAGISGLTSAYRLARAGKRVIVLEARQVGLGTSGHSTGNLYVTVDEHLTRLKKLWGMETAKAVVQSRRSAIEWIEETARMLPVDCGFERVPFHHFTENESDSTLRFLDEEAAVAEAVGIGVESLSRSPLPFKTGRTLRLRDQAQFHPLQYLRGLAASLPERCQIFEHSAVIEIDEKRGVAKTARGSVKASVIISATHTPKGVHPVQLKLSPFREHGVAGELLAGDFPAGIFWRADDPKRSIRKLDVKGKAYVMAIGDRYKTGHNPRNREAVRELETYLESRASWSGVYTWGAQSYRAADALPYIGKQNDHFYFLTGFSADGLVYGTLGASIIADEILGKENPWSELYRPKRITPLKSAKTYLKEGTENLCAYIKDLPGIGSVSLEQIGKDEGGVIDHQGEKIAVYRDSENTVHAVSAVCTHLKCIVTFNPEEKTWDCPCHASRFGLDGKVIEGPALRELEKKDLRGA